MLNLKILSIGEIIFDIYGSEAVIGGAPLNFCAHCALLGAEAALISAVGKDEFASEAIKRLKGFGVNTDFICTASADTGKCIVTTDKNGIPSYDVIRPAAYDRIGLSGEMIKKIKEFGADVFAFGTLIQREKASRDALTAILEACRFDEIICDINLRNNCHDRGSCLNCLTNATILKLSDEEEPILAEYGFYEKCSSPENTVRAITGKFPNIRTVLYTMGEKGSLIYDRKSDEFFRFTPEKVKAVSTVGAGDSYSAAFICEYLKSGDIRKAGEAGTKLSAFVVSRREAVPEK